MTSNKSYLSFSHRVYGKIVFTHPVLVALINTSLFRRLSQIAQLGTSRIWNYHPQHNRFRHSLGVAFLIDYVFKHNPSFRVIDEKVQLETVIAGLLHDLGHGPFSHDFEKLFFPFSHEAQGVALIRDPRLAIAPILTKANLNLTRITNLILGKTKNDFAQNLISSQFDCDRLDYLLNDPYYLKVKLPKPLRWQKLLKAMILDQTRQQITFPISALPDVENYLQARYFLHKRQFWSDNHLLISGCFQQFFRRVNDLYSKHVLALKNLAPFTALWKNATPIPADEFLQWTDKRLITWMKKLTRSFKDPILMFFCANFLSPYSKENRFLLRRFRFLKHVAAAELKKYRYLSFTFKVWSYQSREQPPILFSNQNTQQIVRLDEISELFMKTLRVEEEHRFWLW